MVGSSGVDQQRARPSGAAGAYAPRGLHGQVVEELGRRIVAGELPEGVPFELPALEADLGVSRTALREALKVLGAKGLVDARPRRGTYPLPRAAWNALDPDVLRWTLSAGRNDALFAQLQEVRAIVEPAAARLAAERGAPEAVEAMRGALAAMESAGAAGDVDGVAEADVAFHRLLAAATGNGLLGPIQEVVLVGLRRRDSLVHERRGGLDRPTLDRHRAVLDAIEAGDAVAAEAAMLHLLELAAADAAAVDRAVAAD
ncbi:FadR/GntR family transcriptional regulator [Patulibacter sp. S7RM1-6]